MCTTEGRIEADSNGNAASQHRLIGSSHRPALPQTARAVRNRTVLKYLYGKGARPTDLNCLVCVVRSTENGERAV